MIEEENIPAAPEGFKGEAPLEKKESKRNQVISISFYEGEYSYYGGWSDPEAIIDHSDWGWPRRVELDCAMLARLYDALTPRMDYIRAVVAILEKREERWKREMREKASERSRGEHQP